MIVVIDIQYPCRSGLGLDADMGRCIGVDCKTIIQMTHTMLYNGQMTVESYDPLTLALLWP